MCVSRAVDILFFWVFAGDTFGLSSGSEGVTLLYCCVLVV